LSGQQDEAEGYARLAWIGISHMGMCAYVYVRPFSILDIWVCFKALIRFRGCV